MSSISSADYNTRHGLFDKAKPDYWRRLLELEVDGLLLKTESQKDVYINDIDELLRILDRGSETEKEGLGLPTEKSIAEWKKRFKAAQLSEEEKAKGMPPTIDAAIWELKDRTAFRLVVNLKRMRPSRIHLAPPYLNILSSNPYHNGLTDPLPKLFLGVALSKQVPANADREDEARKTLVEGLNLMSEKEIAAPHNYPYGWANLARLLRRTRRTKAADVIEMKFQEWLKGHPCSYTPSRLQFEIQQDDFIPTPQTPIPPAERMLIHPHFKAWESRIQEIPNTNMQDMVYQGLRVKTDQDYLQLSRNPKVKDQVGHVIATGPHSGGWTGKGWFPHTETPTQVVFLG